MTSLRLWTRATCVPQVMGADGSRLKVESHNSSIVSSRMNIDELAKTSNPLKPISPHQFFKHLYNIAYMVGQNEAPVVASGQSPIEILTHNSTLQGPSLYGTSASRLETEACN